jgi:hypothetical protein
MNLPTKLAGNEAIVYWLNQLRDAVAACQLKKGVGYRVDQSDAGTFIKFDDDKPNTLRRFRLKDDLGACLKVRTWDGTTEGSADVYIAKHPTIRNTVASDTNGNHYMTRAISGSDGSSETDDITPPFIYNGDIYASPIPQLILDSHACNYMEISPRAWASR